MPPAEKSPAPFSAFTDTVLQDSGSSTAIRIFLLILGILFLLDILTTQVILRMGGIELNPFMAGIVSHPVLHSILKIIILLVIFRVSFIAESRVKGSSIFFYCTLILMYIFVVFHNLVFILPRVPL